MNRRRSSRGSLLYGAARVAFVVLLCAFSTADDLTDIITGSLRAAISCSRHARTGNLIDDDRDSIPGAPVAVVSGSGALAGDSAFVLLEFVPAVDSGVGSMPARPTSGGRAPPSVC